MTADLLSVQGLRLGYTRSDVIHGISFRVPKGSIVSLIGANGAGKSTTLRGLSGLLKPRAGSITFSGQEIAGEAPHKIARRRLVQVPEGRQVFAEMTVAENLAMGAYLVPDKAETKRRSDAVIARFPRLGERRTQQAGYLSGGEQQMLAIGRAMMAKPELLLLDEPSMGLAPLIVEEIFRIILQIRSEGSTVLLVEQNAHMALNAAGRAYVLQTGHVIKTDMASALLEDPDVKAAYLGG